MNEWFMANDKIIAATLGTLGFLLGCYNLIRSIKGARDVRSLTYAQHKQEALNLITSGEASSLTAQRLWRELHDRAADCGMRDIMDQAESNVTYETKSLALLRKARQLILTQSPVGRTHDELIIFIDETITKLGDVTNSEKHEQEIQFSMHEFDRAVRLFALVRSRIAEMLTLIADSRSAYLKAQMLMEDVCDAAKGAHGTEVLKEAEQSICGIKDAMDRLQRARETLVLAAAEAATTAEDRIRAAEALHEVTVIVGPIAGAKEIEEESLIHRKSLQRRLTAGDGR